MAKAGRGLVRNRICPTAVGQTSLVKLTGPAGAIIMKRWLDKAGVSHQARDGRTFHALRRTTGTRLVESGAELGLTAQVLGHAGVDSSRRYIALADESLRDSWRPRPRQGGPAMTVTFNSGFANHIEAMLEWRTGLGYARRTLAYPMLNFDRFCLARQPGETILSRALVSAWCQAGMRVDWPTYKAHAIREFVKYRAIIT